MDEGFSLPCYLNFRKAMKLLSQEVVVIFSQTSVPDGLLLNLQVHGKPE